MNAAWTGVLKYSLHRQRPDGSDTLSLPSGHTSTAFALATVAERHYGWKAGLPAYALAAGIGLSRIESNKPLPQRRASPARRSGRSWAARSRASTAGARPRAGRCAVTPATDAHGAGIGLGFSASW